MVETTKKVREVFKDYEAESNIMNACIKQLNLIKKENKLEMVLESDEYIEIKELWFIEKFMKQRFKLQETEIILKYTEDVKIKGIKEEWENITCYMARKYPITKSMLVKSTVEIKENELQITLPVKGADFLKAKKFDKALGKLIKNMYGKEYRINLLEDINEEEVHAAEEKRIRAEKLAVERTMEHWTVEQLEGEDGKHKENKEKKENNKNKEPKAEKTDDYIEEVPIIVEEETPLIFGRNMNIKDNLVKVNELSPDEGRVAISRRNN